MSIVFIALLTVHIACASVVFGYPLGLVSTVRRALNAGSAQFSIAATEAARKGKITSIFAILTLVTGISLIMVRGGFAGVSRNFHWAMLLMIVAIVFSAAWMKPNTAKLEEAAGENIDQELAESALKKLGMGSGILHTLWLLILLLMLYRF